MSCFLYSTPISPPSPLLSSPPDPHPPSFCHDASAAPAADFPSLERDYMGIGLTLKHIVPAQDTARWPVNSISAVHNSPPKNPDGIPISAADRLCGNLLRLAPPSSSADEGGADDGEPLSGNVGWPPISSYRKATTRLLSIKPPCNDDREIVEIAPILLTPQASLSSDNNNEDQENSANPHALDNDASYTVPFPTKSRKPLHIKVSMDGTPIMRKLDLISMQGYQHLFLELRKLFKFYKRNLSCDMGVHSRFKDSKGANFILTYKDKYGNWVLVGDTPWKIFSHSARRIRIMKIVE